MEAINKRRSIRKYSDKQVEDEKIDKLLRAAMQAAGSRLGSEPWEFIVVKDKNTIQKLSEMSPNAKLVSGANVAIVLLANMDRVHYPLVWQQDMAAAAENLLLEASYLDLGAVWIGTAPVQERMDYLSELFNLGENIRPFNIISIGYPAEGQENKFLDKYDETRVHYEKY
ncbi:nitroreductase family protein [Methanobrevibacter sp. DSM 116169]|uniref:nitroreductase family protein n=1 Tax=Methanobrevibacter sp. DSM 116169 TaxID=3242727 RepID=UPI0038FCBDC8